MRNFLWFLKELFLLFIPRFINEPVALYKHTDGTLQIISSVEFLREEDKLHVDCYGTVRVFTFMGWCIGGEALIDTPES